VTKTLAISSGKGGVGKTTVTVNCGLALADLGKRVLLVDADLGLANLDILAGVEVRRTLAHAIHGDATLNELLVDVAPGLQLLPASSGVLKLERLSHDQQGKLAAELHELAARYDVVLLDTGAGITENVLFFDSIADEVLLVTTPEPTAVTDTYALIKILATQRQLSALSLLVNKVGSVADGSLIHERLMNVCQQFLHVSLGYAGQVFKDSAVEQAVMERIPIVRGRRSSAASSSLLALARRFDQVFHAPSRTPEISPAYTQRRSATSLIAAHDS
jgi:flagellar biosynthesis protein FlhG